MTVDPPGRAPDGTCQSCGALRGQPHHVNCAFLIGGDERETVYASRVNAIYVRRDRSEVELLRDHLDDARAEAEHLRGAMRLAVNALEHSHLGLHVAHQTLTAALRRPA